MRGVGDDEAGSQAGYLSRWQSSVLMKASSPLLLSSGSGHPGVLPPGQRALLHPCLPAVCTLAVPKPPGHLSHSRSPEWSWREPCGCSDSSPAWLLAAALADSLLHFPEPLVQMFSTWRPQTHISLNCAQLMTSSASGRLESHKVNFSEFHPLCISFSVCSPILPSFSLISWKSALPPLPPSYPLP